MSDTPAAAAELSALAPLTTFVQEATALVDATRDENTRTRALTPLLARLVASDDWLPAPYALAHPQRYQQYLLHCDPHERFSVVSFVWGPGQKTPIHDHTVWGLIGMLRGAEISTPYHLEDGRPIPGAPVRLSPGDVDTLSPASGDIHQVENAFEDRVSISVHVYGANIGKVRRHVFDPVTGKRHHFVSGFSATTLPNLWE